VSLKRLSGFLDNKELGKENVLQYPQSEETGIYLALIVYN